MATVACVAVVAAGGNVCVCTHTPTSRSTTCDTSLQHAYAGIGVLHPCVNSSGST